MNENQVYSFAYFFAYFVSLLNVNFKLVCSGYKFKLDEFVVVWKYSAEVLVTAESAI